MSSRVPKTCASTSQEMLGDLTTGKGMGVERDMLVAGRKNVDDVM